ncbi:patatin-like phospholipase family protein [Aquitalea sp.]|uniref:patatin-like phospholipase family protein n=1 Tax=Aquitalea sp. TaxID=1872623 RepID=UPI002584AAEA|nr:patatin-like phospholipase family protein [Aquitalea sp.]
MRRERRIGLVLSGGGIRAMVFHAGVLREMAEHGELEQVVQISTVSGGSLVAGLIMQLAGGQWPSSLDYLNHVGPQLTSLLTRHRTPLRRALWWLCKGRPTKARASLQQSLAPQDVVWTAIRELVKRPWLIRSRPHCLAAAYRRCWGVTDLLGSLPTKPTWSINGTTAEYGVRFRFKRDDMGDYELGYALSGQFPLAEAMAVSSAVPGIIGPLRLPTPNGKWFKWKANLVDAIADGSAVPKLPKFDSVKLYDGGVYDNLGLEPFFDCGSQLPKLSDVDYLVVSDAGKPFTPGKTGWFSAMRMFDIASEQTRALRVRAFVNHLKGGVGRGQYLQIGTDPFKFLAKYAPGADESGLKLSSEERRAAKDYPTRLRRMPEADFKRVEQHGYETALVNRRAFSWQEVVATHPADIPNII